MMLKHYHIEALEFIGSQPAHEVGAISSDEEMVAYLVFADLLRMGFLLGTLKPGQGGIRLSPTGELAIAKVENEQ